MTELDPSTLHAPEYWNERYSARDPLWSGKVNQRLAEQTEGVEPGAALDIGCGEGGDAVWLAQRGWSVTAVDVSDVVIDKARAHAEQALPAEVADRITWHPADVRTWQPPDTSFDLVSMQYIHLAEALLGEVLDTTLWQIELAQPFPRPAKDREGRPVVLHDTVVRAMRR